MLDHETIEEAISVRITNEEWRKLQFAIVSTYELDTLQVGDLMDRLEGEPANYKLPQYFDVVHPDEFSGRLRGAGLREDVVGWNVNEGSRVRDVRTGQSTNVITWAED